MATVTLRNHPGYWMRADAEASLARWEAAHGVIGVNSAGRYEWEQQKLIDRWDQGGAYNRPPYLYEPKRPARASSHVYEGGIAFDTSEWQRFLKTCADYGWYQRYSWDVVHFEYVPANDKYRNQAAGNASKPATNAPEGEEEDEDMAMKGATYKRGTTNVFILFNEVSGFYVEHSGVDSAYNNSIAQKWGTGSWPTITQAHATVIKRSLDAIRRTAVSGSLSVEISDDNA